MSSFNYTTVEGDANPLIPLTAVFPLGTVLVIPIVEDSDMHVNTDLPPWKR